MSFKYNKKRYQCEDVPSFIQKSVIFFCDNYFDGDYTVDESSSGDLPDGEISYYRSVDIENGETLLGLAAHSHSETINALAAHMSSLYAALAARLRDVKIINYLSTADLSDRRTAAEILTDKNVYSCILNGAQIHVLTSKYADKKIGQVFKDKKSRVDRIFRDYDFTGALNDAAELTFNESGCTPFHKLFYPQSAAGENQFFYAQPQSATYAGAENSTGIVLVLRVEAAGGVYEVGYRLNGFTVEKFNSEICDIKIYIKSVFTQVNSSLKKFCNAGNIGLSIKENFVATGSCLTLRNRVFVNTREFDLDIIVPYEMVDSLCRQLLNDDILEFAAVFGRHKYHSLVKSLNDVLCRQMESAPRYLPEVIDRCSEQDKDKMVRSFIMQELTPAEYGGYSLGYLKLRYGLNPGTPLFCGVIKTMPLDVREGIYGFIRKNRNDDNVESFKLLESELVRELYKRVRNDTIELDPAIMFDLRVAFFDEIDKKLSGYFKRVIDAGYPWCASADIGSEAILNILINTDSLALARSFYGLDAGRFEQFTRLLPEKRRIELAEDIEFIGRADSPENEEICEIIGAKYRLYFRFAAENFKCRDRFKNEDWVKFIGAGLAEEHAFVCSRSEFEELRESVKKIFFYNKTGDFYYWDFASLSIRKIDLIKYMFFAGLLAA